MAKIKDFRKLEVKYLLQGADGKNKGISQTGGKIFIYYYGAEWRILYYINKWRRMEVY